MTRWLGILGLFVLMACGDKKTSLSGNVPVKAKDFQNAFADVKLPTTIYDTSLARLGDTSTISRTVLAQFVPDSALQQVVGKDKKIIFHPIGKINRDDEQYFLIKVQHNKKNGLVVFVFDKEVKFMAAKELIAPDIDDAYSHAVNINKEPTFTISREKITDENKMFYTRTGYAYIKEAGFMIAVNDSNEDTKRQDSIINPIDTFARKNPFSGDYVKDKKNFISLRDGKNPSTYRFFVHFEKSNGNCIGELKGEMTIKDQKTGQYTANGDPCVINFKFDGNDIRMKEEGTCGNHRDIKCFFDDIFTRKREPKPKSKKK